MARQGCSPSPACAASVRTGCYRSEENQKLKDIIFLEGDIARR